MNFQDQQFALTAHIRDPDGAPAPAGIEDRRIAVYRDLFFNNVDKLLASSFPVLRKLLGDDRWRLLVRDYFSTHRAKTPYFKEVPQEFLQYLHEERGARDEDPAFLYELAHYEWAELAVSLLPDAELPADLDATLSLLDGIPVLNNAAWSLAYRFDVHRIAMNHQPDTPPEQPTFLVVYRRPDYDMGFLEINAVTARLIELAQRDEGAAGRTLLTRIAEELNHPNPDVVVQGGADILRQLAEHHIIVGARPAVT
ncbi:MAG: DUF2063 domain-containing protein [Gammaproteobacteria bacterium]